VALWHCYGAAELQVACKQAQAGTKRMRDHLQKYEKVVIITSCEKKYTISSTKYFLDNVLAHAVGNFVQTYDILVDYIVECL
jgi:hypothetical protein